MMEAAKKKKSLPPWLQPGKGKDDADKGEKGKDARAKNLPPWLKKGAAKKAKGK